MKSAKVERLHVASSILANNCPIYCYKNEAEEEKKKQKKKPLYNKYQEEKYTQIEHVIKRNNKK